MRALTGAVLIGFLAGACARNFSNTASTRGGDGAVESRALAATTPAAGGGNIDLRKLSATYAALAKKVTPAVVNVNSEQLIRGRVFSDPMSEFFGGSGVVREPDRRAESLGSGVIVDSKGIIITNNHVIENATNITVTLNDRRRFVAKKLGADPDADVAVLKIDAGAPLSTVPWANSDTLEVGDIVLAIGSPFNLTATVTQGIISAKERRDLGISQVEDFLQTDAAINPGNSGGALIDINGNLAGINTAILSRSGGNQGIGLAIPSNLARKIAGQLEKTGSVSRGYLGLQAIPLTQDISNELRYKGNGGVLVTGVDADGPTGKLPWQRSGGNVLLKANGIAIDSPRQLGSIIAAADPGDKMTLEVWQNGQSRTFTVTVARQSERAREALRRSRQQSGEMP